MGLEVGWYLRLSRADTMEVLISETALGQLEDQAGMNPHWSMETEARDGFLRVVFCRLKPMGGGQ